MLHLRIMNILQINATDNPIGGASKMAYELYTALKKKHGSTMIVGKKSQETQHDLGISSIPKTFLQKLQSYLCANDLDFFKTDFILDTAQFKNADVVHCHNIHGWYFNLQTLQKMAVQKPIVWTLHDMWAITPHCAHAYDGELRDGFYSCRSLKDYPATIWNNDSYLSKRKRAVYEASNFTIVVPSQWLYNKVKKSALGKKDIRLIHNGVDTNIFYRTDKRAARAELNLPLDKKIILFISNGGLANTFKGGDHIKKLIELYKDNHDMNFVCVGGDIDTEENCSQVIYRKKISNQEVVAHYMNASDALLFPSAAENFPLVLLEAMACGLPIVTFNVGGTAEAVQNLRNGFVTQESTTEELQRGLEYVIRLDTDTREQMAQNSIADIKENFSLERMVEKYILLYNELANKTK